MGHSERGLTGEGPASLGINIKGRGERSGRPVGSSADGPALTQPSPLARMTPGRLIRTVGLVKRSGERVSELPGSNATTPAFGDAGMCTCAVARADDGSIRENRNRIFACP